MTTLGPYTQATLIYEPVVSIVNGEIATPGTMLDYITKKLPHFLPIIKNARKMPFYNSEGRYTLFVPKSSEHDYHHLDPNLSIRILNMSTVPGIITTDMFLNNQTIFPLDHPRNNLYIRKNLNTIKVSDKQIIFGNIECNNGIIHIIDSILWPIF